MKKIQEIQHNKKLLIGLILLLIFASALGVWEIMATHQEEQEQEEVIPPPPPSDPLTGALVEDGFDESALQRRIVAFVVENTPDARPQWGMDDENYPPEIMLQAEVEGGITRTLWFYSDYKKVPEIIGPTRSARPPFIRFSEYFDAVFIHWGQSYSKGDYIGANKIFEWHDVDHINQMTLDDKEGLYDRDFSRNVSSEHTGIIHTDKLEATMKNEGIRETPNVDSMSKLYFNETATPPSTETAAKLSVTYSKRADWETTDWEYNQEDEMYHTSSFDNDFKRDNLLILYDDTEYVTKDDYHGAGGSVTYCDYLFTGGKAQLFSKGAVKDLLWENRAGKLMLIDPDITTEEVDAAVATAMEEDKKLSLSKATREVTESMNVVLADVPMKDDELEEAKKEFEAKKEAGEVEADAEFTPEKYVVQRLNKGKTWIGWISSNNGGSVKITPGDYTITMPGEEAAEAGESAEAGTEGAASGSETTESTN